MRRKKLLLALSLVVNATLVVHTAHADRRSGLAGNLLIEDPDDLFAFPQLTLQHRNLIRFDYGGNSSSGNGVLTLGNQSEACSIAVHRGDLLSPDQVGYNTELSWLGGVEGAAPLSNTSYGAFQGPALAISGETPAAAQPVLPSTVVDLSYARKLGQNPLGLRLGFGRGVRARKNATDDVQKGAQTFLAAQLGYSERPLSGLRWDASGNAVISFGKSTDPAGQDINAGWNLRIAGLARAYYPLNRLVDVGFLANASIANERTKTEVVLHDTSRDFEFGVRAAVGPSIHLDRAKIAAYGGTRITAGKNVASSNANNEENRLRLAAPMVNLAVEVLVLDWLYVRTGAEYDWLLRRDGSANAKERIGDGSFHWSLGLGLQKGTFYFDGVVTNGFVTGGPNFIGGNANGFLAMASMTYKFGDVFSGHALDVPSEPIPEPVSATLTTTPLPIERPPPAVAEPQEVPAATGPLPPQVSDPPPPAAPVPSQVN